ncbi:UNVERIFIED_CONTAM: peptidoglycan/LPS O-acetylase OafA/YrhL [Streptomyces canus]
METTTSTRETTRKDTGTARSPAVVATLSALLLLAASIAGQIAAGADYPTVPPGLVIPLVAAALLVWRTNRWTTGLALGVGLFIGAGAILTPNTGDHLSSGDTALVASTAAELVALATLVIAGAAATLPRKGTRR